MLVDRYACLWGWAFAYVLGLQSKAYKLRVAESLTRMCMAGLAQAVLQVPGRQVQLGAQRIHLCRPRWAGVLYQTRMLSYTTPALMLDQSRV